MLLKSMQVTDSITTMRKLGTMNRLLVTIFLWALRTSYLTQAVSRRVLGFGRTT